MFYEILHLSSAILIQRPVATDLYVQRSMVTSLSHFHAFPPYNTGLSLSWALLFGAAFAPSDNFLGIFLISKHHSYRAQ